MSLLDDFIKDWDRDHYKRHPKSRMPAKIMWVILLLLLIIVAIRAVKLIFF